ncbi:hypothetical protein DEO72_LG9g1304 [Vigna unguiculata]|uniref:PB1-like domain-containing protein n=1 Tax=Vigna unguiculata TaxID=3917 RepID=A0A4D6MXX6_VIGUN|nr:hypothetical protein DEO72_LG9g1304 [Vigna unguiculata]
MGKFERFRGRMLHYEGGEKHVVRGLDPDMWSYFEALGILKKDFKHALELAKYPENRNKEVEIYVDHLVSSAQVIELVEGVNGGGVNEDHSTVAVNGVGANVVVNGGVVREEEANAVVNGGGLNEEEANADADAINGGGVNEADGVVMFFKRWKI